MPGRELCARLDPTVPAEPGRAMPFMADLNNMHLIETQSGRVL
jgi:multiple sugar transport system ATP-binding protein